MEEFRPADPLRIQSGCIGILPRKRGGGWKEKEEEEEEEEGGGR